MKKIVVCDDHILFCNGLRELLISAGRNYEVEMVHSSDECKSYFNSGKEVDVFICDLNIDNRDGFLLLEELKHELRGVKVIILSAYYEDFLIQKAERLGIHAFLKKETTSEELIEVIERDTTLPFYSQKPKLAATNEFQQRDSEFVNKVKLSNQEKKIIQLIVKGKTSKEIGDVLFISKATVDTHRRNINRKLGITNVSSLIQFAHENNLCD